jgi:hypothetical protein
VIALSPEAEFQIDQLIAHFEAKARIGAAINLLNAIERAKQRSIRAPGDGLEAPRPYPALKRAGRYWLVEGRYWISYSLVTPPVISGVYYVTADIPARL